MLLFQYDVYVNANILEPEIIPFCLIYIVMDWFPLKLWNLIFYVCFFFKFPQILPQFMSLAYSFSHFSFALGNTCGLRILCIHFGFKSIGLIKWLQFDNRDISTIYLTWYCDLLTPSVLHFLERNFILHVLY